MAHGSKTVIYAALAGNTLISITKFAAASMTGSAAMLAEGVHSLVDTGNQALLLLGLKRAKRPPSEDFPFGHGKEIYFWSFIVAILIFAAGAGVSIYEGVHRVMHPEPVTNPMINFVVLGLAVIFEGGAWFMALREFRAQQGNRGFTDAIKHSKDPTVFVVLFEDTAALLGLMVAMIGLVLATQFNLPIFDGIASIVIGLILAFTAIWLARETKSLLIGEAADPELVADVRRRAAEISEVDNVNEVLTLHMGPDYILLTLSVDFADEVKAGELEQVIESLTQEVRAAHPEIKRVFVEAESVKSA
ncbi:MAG: cation transporter [Planctomycetes bacterium]|jgi:cation diffusion facilitator family transporter|nr:cation transporter [Planctomycetota bacterium]MBT4028901.1 cation transporter [Planctomycetota bacterium]MBT4561244.1 cation transporter [Planctomycetota bacterium]MBT5101621.1 cation transporter [Planctomycetota bacterium]MBT5119203.1 cation transporter [Planctomycetota bacterium]